MIHLDPAVGRESSAAFGTSVVPEDWTWSPAHPGAPPTPGLLKKRASG